MKPHFSSSATSWLVALLLLTVSVSAKDTPPAPDSPDDTRKIVRAVDRSAGSVEVQTMFDQAMHHYKIDLGTVITVNGGAGKISDIKVGMQLDDYVERDPETLDSISLVPGDGANATTAKGKVNPARSK